MKTAKKVLSGTLNMARGTATMLGMAVMLAVVLGVGTTALAAVPGDPFKLGKTNTIDKMSKLVGNANGALLRIENEGSGPALDLQAEPEEPPMTVDSTIQVNNLNADQVDGQNADEFMPGAIYTDTEQELGSGGGSTQVVLVNCDLGDKLLGGGGGSTSEEDTLVESQPLFGEFWRVEVRDKGESGISNIVADAICADLPPLRP
jgi:hypothetical protein